MSRRSQVALRRGQFPAVSVISNRRRQALGGAPIPESESAARGRRRLPPSRADRAQRARRSRSPASGRAPRCTQRSGTAMLETRPGRGRPRRQLSVEALAYEPMEENERDAAGCRGHCHTGKRVVSAEESPNSRDERRIQGEEGRRSRRPVVPSFGYSEKPIAVPPRPHVDRWADVMQPTCVESVWGDPIEEQYRRRRERPD